MDRTKIKHMNQLEIAQNEIWTPQKFPAIRYLYLEVLNVVRLAVAQLLSNENNLKLISSCSTL